jgi:hypothetical protein
VRWGDDPATFPEEIALTYARAVVFGACVLLSMLAALQGMAADAPAPKDGHRVARDFRFHMPDLQSSMPRGEIYGRER